MATYRKVDAARFEDPPRAKPRGRPLSPEQQALVRRMRSLKDESVVFEAVLDEGEKPATVRAQLLRAAKLAEVDVAVKRSAKGFYFGLMTPQRASRRGRPRTSPAA